MQRLEDSGAVRPIYGSLGVKRLIKAQCWHFLGGTRETHKTADLGYLAFWPGS